LQTNNAKLKRENLALKTASVGQKGILTAANHYIPVMIADFLKEKMLYDMQKV